MAPFTGHDAFPIRSKPPLASQGTLMCEAPPVELLAAALETQAPETFRHTLASNSEDTSASKFLSNTADALPKLEYGPLEPNLCEIRLLNILHDDDASILRCSLSHISFDTTPMYTALSYCWGDSQDTRPIIIDNCEVQVTVNLDSGLRELRRRGENVIWVDAICIDQANTSERSHQVSLMGKIYSRAAKTISWLGEDPQGHATEALEIIQLLATRNPLKEFANAVTYINSRRSIQAPPRWTAFRKFYGLPYWRRTWIIQEIALSSSTTVAWGKSSVSFETVLQCVRNASTITTSTGSVRSPLNKLNLDRNFNPLHSFVRIMGSSSTKRQPRHNMESILGYTFDSEASDSRDKIYGVLALCKDVADGRTVLEPDYTKPLSEIVLQVASAMICGATYLEIICLKNPYTPNRKGVPSWVPHWQEVWERDFELYKSLISLNNRGLKGQYNATKRCRRKTEISIDGRTLKVTGILFDLLIESVHPSGIPRSGTATNAQSSVYGLKTCDAIWRTLVMDRLRGFSSGRPPPAWQESFSLLWTSEGLEAFDSRFPIQHKPSFRKMKTVQLFGKSLGEWAEFKRLPPAEDPSLAEIQSVVREPQAVALAEFVRALKVMNTMRRRIIVTGKGYLGLGHAQCQAGDHICLIQGCSVPVILRKEGNNYTMIGEAYIHGIMDGEAWDGASTTEEFSIC